MKSRQNKNLSELTPYEQRIHDLKMQGLTWPEIAKELNNKHHSTIRSHYMKVVQEKLELQKYEKQEHPSSSRQAYAGGV